MLCKISLSESMLVLLGNISNLSSNPTAAKA